MEYVEKKVPELKPIDGKTQNINIRSLFATLATEKSDIDNEVVYSQIKQLRELYVLGNLMKKVSTTDKAPIKIKETYYTEHNDASIMEEARNHPG